MRSFMTQTWPIVAFGEGSAQTIGQKFQEKKIHRILVFYDQGVYQAGIVEPILKELTNQGMQIVRYDRVQADVPDYTIEEAATLAKQTQVNGFLAIGGGSVMDTAKNTAVYLFCPEPVQYYFTHTFIVENSLKAQIYLICVPTTAGTGAEMTGGGPVYDTVTHQKRGLKFPARYADMAILDPLLTVGLPPYITAITALDALAHSIESMTGKTRSPRTDLFGGQAVEYIWRSLPLVLEQPSHLEARGELLLAANMAIGVEAYRHLGHAVAHAIGGMFHLAHGHACAITLPSVVRFIAKNNTLQRELCLIADKMGLVYNQAFVGEAIAGAIEKVNQTVGVKSLKECGCTKNELLACVPICFSDIRNINNAPETVSEKEILALLSAIYEA